MKRLDLLELHEHQGEKMVQEKKMLKNLWSQYKKLFKVKFHGFVMINLFSGILTLLVFPNMAQAEWELLEDDNGIKVYSREIQGSEYKEFKITTVIYSSLASIIGVLRDVKSCPDCVYLCKESKIIKTLNLKEVYTYSLIEMPFPFDDRELVLYAKTTADPATNEVTIIIESINNQYPKTEHIRLITKGSYHLKPLYDDSVEFTMIQTSNPGGSIPAMFVNMGQQSYYIEMATKLKQMVAREKYQKLEFKTNSEGEVILFGKIVSKK